MATHPVLTLQYFIFYDDFLRFAFNAFNGIVSINAFDSPSDVLVIKYTSIFTQYHMNTIYFQVY